MCNKSVLILVNHFLFWTTYADYHADIPIATKYMLIPEIFYLILKNTISKH